MVYTFLFERGEGSSARGMPIARRAESESNPQPWQATASMRQAGFTWRSSRCWGPPYDERIRSSHTTAQVTTQLALSVRTLGPRGAWSASRLVIVGDDQVSSYRPGARMAGHGLAGHAWSWRHSQGWRNGSVVPQPLHVNRQTSRCGR